MTNLVEIPAVARVLIGYFSAHNEQAGADLLADVTVNDKLPLAVLKDELQIQNELAWILQCFRANPFDMENVFDLEDGLRKALEKHPVFMRETLTAEIPATDIEGPPPLFHSFHGNEAQGERGGFKVFTALPEQGDLLEKRNGSLQTLMRYLRWSNEVFYQACDKLPEVELTTNRPMLFDNILNLLNHVYAMQRVWQAHLQGKPHNITSRRPVDGLDFETLRLQQTALDTWYIAYADDLPVGLFAELVDFEFIDGGEGTMTRDEILHHVVNHTSYHRGHIEGVFYQLGVEPPTTDLPVFLRLCSEQSS